jgi:hypothetical protein
MTQYIGPSSSWFNKRWLQKAINSSKKKKGGGEATEILL